ncbi:hypothetical protein KKE34_01145 [Patescibacteria group bacterium]|nr:hypothetical protein [Patescibacteria group bacterium]MBU1885194.1 hypothetical protein [Patescibacteria group bacterium]
MKINRVRAQAGQTLIEILIVTVVVATVLTAIAGSLSMSAKNTSENKKLSMSTTYAQEALEVFRREKYALGWESFQLALVDGIYCLDTIPADSAEFFSLAIGACGASETIPGTNFLREATLTSAVDEVRVVIVVKWTDAETNKESTAEQTFKEIN